MLHSEADAATDQKDGSMPIQLVEEPKIFRDKKGQEIVVDARRLNSIKRPIDYAAQRKSVVVHGEKSEKSMADESFSDDNFEETKHDTAFQP